MINLITGVSKGIGLALTAEALLNGNQVYGVARNPEGSPELLKLQKQYPSLKIIKLDLSDANASEKLLNAMKDCRQIDVLINNAGIYEQETTKNAFLKSFEVNAYTPFMVTETLISKLKSSAIPKVIHITSLMGSIGDNSSGNSYAYRASKSALNMIHKCLSIDHNWLISAAIHPGWVQTSMGGEAAPISPAVSSHGIWKVISELTISDTGCFKDYQGRILPW